MSQSDISDKTIEEDVRHFLEQIILWNTGRIGTERIGFKQRR